MVTNNHYRWDFLGLSTDTKPTPDTSDKVVDGSTFYCSDTSKLYVFCKNNWYERKPLGGGGGGGTSYTAGDGITIADDTISVDTTTIQEKLTAGTGIDITNNTISATGGGGGVTPVQTTGTSTTDVMSQNATTSMVFADPGTDKQIQIGANAHTAGTNGILIGTGTYNASNANSNISIGNGATAHESSSYDCVALGRSASAGSNSTIAIGRNASASQQGGIALGAYSTVTRKGEVNIGTSWEATGYNNTNYRIIGGVHDGQLAQDAVTVSQVNSVIDAINTALSTNISHIGA